MKQVGIVTRETHEICLKFLLLKNKKLAKQAKT